MALFPAEVRDLLATDVDRAVAAGDLEALGGWLRQFLAQRDRAVAPLLPMRLTSSQTVQTPSRSKRKWRADRDGDFDRLHG